MRPTTKPRTSRPRFQRKRFCKFCADKIDFIDYKDIRILRHYLTERGKMMAARMSGTCAKHQRELAQAIKRARSIALLPFVEKF
ncbi:MAG: 30S ribosomal protein S18 [Thermodesulfovibrionia bacterium]|nr:30S ribosomal protein S18 [Thermodesulfovibrionia bacterium]